MIAILSKNILYYFLKEWIWQKFDKRDKKEIEAKQQSSKTKWLNNYKKKKTNKNAIAHCRFSELTVRP